MHDVDTAVPLPVMHDLPELNAREADVVAAMLHPHAGFHDLAEMLGMTLGEFFSALASPNVRSHLRHARRMLAERVAIRLADAAHKAVDVLEEIVQTPAAADPWHTERRRAATILLRAHIGPAARRPSRTDRKHIDQPVTHERIDSALESLTPHTETPPNDAIQDKPCRPLPRPYHPPCVASTSTTPPPAAPSRPP